MLTNQTHYRADIFEDILADWFENQGVRVEREMVKEQMEEHGNSQYPRPAILRPCRINGNVAWIDAKHFYGADVNFKEKIVKQAGRYVDTWGQGALVFDMDL